MALFGYIALDGQGLEQRAHLGGRSLQVERQVVEGTQILAASIVAAAKRFPEKSIRSAYSVFARAVLVGAGPVELGIDVISEGRSTATVQVWSQRCCGLSNSGSASASCPQR